MTDGIQLHIEDGLARVTFDRPASLNAMDFPMARRWREVAHEVTTDASVGAVILDANGPAFCAGGDVVAMATTGASGSDVTETRTRSRRHPHLRRSPCRWSPPCRERSRAEESGSCSRPTTSSRARTPASSAGTRTSASPRSGRLDAAARRDRPAPRAAVAVAGPYAHRRGGPGLGSGGRGRGIRRSDVARERDRPLLARRRQRRVRAGDPSRARGRGSHVRREPRRRSATIGAAFETPEAKARVAAFAAASAKGHRS